MPEDKNEKMRNLRELGENGRQKHSGFPKGKSSPKSAALPVVDMPREDPGFALVLKMFEEAGRRQLTTRDMAEEVGLSAGYLSRLRHGGARVPDLQRATVESIARFLGLPVITVMMLAEQVQPEDYYGPEGTGLGNELERAIRFMESDPDWCRFLPKGMGDAAPDWKLALVMLYEQATGTKLIPMGVDHETTLELVQGLQDERKQASSAEKPHEEEPES